MGRRAGKTNKTRLWAILGLLAGLFWLFPGNPAQADDRKTRVITFLSSGDYTTTTAYSTGFDVSAYNEGQILVNATVESGTTSTLDFTVQTSDDNTTYYDHTTLTQITAIGQTRYAITNFGKYVRLKYVISGGYTFTN
jgi:hypothetical protein